MARKKGMGMGSSSALPIPLL